MAWESQFWQIPRQYSPLKPDPLYLLDRPISGRKEKQKVREWMTGLVWLWAILDTTDKSGLRIVQFDSEKVVQSSLSETQRCSKILFLFFLGWLNLCFVGERCGGKARGVLYALKDLITLQNNHFAVQSFGYNHLSLQLPQSIWYDNKTV